MARRPKAIRRRFKRGEILFHEGERGGYAYLLLSGQVSIIKGTAHGMVTVATLGANSIFGEMALIDRSFRMASAIADKDADCYLIDRQVFEDRVATLAAAETIEMSLLLEYIRNTLPWKKRVKIAPIQKVNEQDVEMWLYMKERALSKFETGDQFLQALHEILKSYVVRRLPPDEFMKTGKDT